MLKPLAKRVLIPLGVTVAAPTADQAMKKEKFGSGMAALITSNKEMYDININKISWRIWFIDQNC